jgi:hypothetical protein
VNFDRTQVVNYAQWKSREAIAAARAKTPPHSAARPQTTSNTNTWRVHSEANTQDALLHTFESFAGRTAANAFVEFRPHVQRRVFHKHN